MPDIEVSVDEYVNARKAFADDKGHVFKGLAADEKRAPSSFNKETGACRFTMSAEIEDRDNDIVVQSGLDLTEFLKNPAAPFAHRSGTFPIGNWFDIEKVLGGRPKRTEGTLQPVAGDPDADRLKLHMAAGTIRACSIGFMPKRIERRQQDENVRGWPGYMIHEAELYECSPCMIPANPAALAKSAEANGLLPREILEKVLDEWTMQDGLLVRRADYEAALRAAGAGKTTFIFQGKTFEVTAGADGQPDVKEETKPESPPETKEAGWIRRIAKVLGLGDDPTKDPDTIAAVDIKVAVDARTPEEKLRDQFAKDMPILMAKHEILEADARMAALDTEMASHLAA